MNMAEREELRSCLSPDCFRARALRRDLLVGVGLYAATAGCAALLILVLQLHLPPVVAGILAAIPVLAGIITFFFGANMIAGAFRFRAYGRRHRNNTVPKLQEALEDGRVEVTRVVASAVIVLEESEDEGTGYLFDVGNGQTLLLKGQEYEPVRGEPGWTNTEFEIVRTARHSLWVGLFCSGAELRPLKTIPLAQCDQEFIWSSHEKVLEGNPEQVLATLILHR